MLILQHAIKILFMGSKGVSQTISTILVLMITVGIAGTGYVFMQSNISGLTSESFNIIEAVGTTVYVKNIGTKDISSMNGFIDDQPVLITNGFGCSLSSGLTGYWKFDEGNITGMVAHWKFNEGSGTIASDSSGSYTGSLSSVSWVEGKYRTGVNFAAASSIMTLSSGVPMATPYTISVWSLFPLPASPGWWRTLTRSAVNDHQVLVDGNGMLGVYDNAGGTGFHSSGYDVDVLAPGWHHLAAVGSGSTTTFYIDGALVGTSTYKSPSAVDWIGSCCGGQTWGRLDDMRIYNRALSQSEIRQLYNTTSDDISGSGNTATFPNSTDWTLGKSGYSSKPDGVNNYLNAPVGSYYGGNNPLSAVAWAYVTASGNGPIVGITSCQPGGCWNMPFLSMAGTTVYGWIWNVNGNVPLSYITATNAWHFLAITYTPTGAGEERFYVDGQEVAAGTGQYAPSGSFNYYTTFISGAKPSGVNPHLNAAIDDVRIYNRVLTPQEITDLYNCFGFTPIAPKQVSAVQLVPSNPPSQGTHTIKLCSASQCLVKPTTV